MALAVLAWVFLLIITYFPILFSIFAAKNNELSSDAIAGIAISDGRIVVKVSRTPCWDSKWLSLKVTGAYNINNSHQKKKRLTLADCIGMLYR